MVALHIIDGALRSIDPALHFFDGAEHFSAVSDVSYVQTANMGERGPKSATVARSWVTRAGRVGRPGLFGHPSVAPGVGPEGRRVRSPTGLDLDTAPPSRRPKPDDHSRVAWGRPGTG